jgi:hypothetical protein
MHNFFSLLAFFYATATISAQQPLPVIRATSKDLVIKDGPHLLRGVIVPEAKPDIYRAEMPQKSQRISIHTNIDSIVLVTQFGKQYDFIILLNERDSCFLRVSTEPHFTKSTKSGTPNGRDTLPFTMRNNRIFLKGKINGVPDVLIQFDLGAGGSAINHRSVNKIPMNFDAQTYLVNSDGGNNVRASSKNTLEIGPFKWENEYFVETRNMERWEDAIVGNALFLDKYVEVDYDHQHLIIHDTMPGFDAKAFQKHDMFLDGGIRPCIQCTIGVKGKNYKHWYLFDTGNTGNALLARAVTSIPGIYGEMTKLIGMGDKRVGVLPELVVSGHSFDNLIVTLEKPTSTTPASEMGLIGNAILKRFNVIMDNAQGFIYLKPNSQMANPLETKRSVMRKAGIWAGVVASLLLLGYVIKTNKK